MGGRNHGIFFVEVVIIVLYIQHYSDVFSFIYYYYYYYLVQYSGLIDSGCEGLSCIHFPNRHGYMECIE